MIKYFKYLVYCWQVYDEYLIKIDCNIIGVQVVSLCFQIWRFCFDRLELFQFGLFGYENGLF